MNARHKHPRRAMAEVRFEHLPPAIAAKLRESVARVRRILWTRGALATLATAVIAILIIMGIDAAVVIYSAWVRWALSLAGLAAVVFVALRMLVRPLAKPFTPARIAALIEQRHPELEERLSTVVELLTAPETRDRGSEQLLQVLTHAAESDAKDVAPEQEFTTRTVKPKLVAAAVALGILGVLLAAWPRHAGRLFARAVAPYAELDNVYADNLIVRPGSHVMLAGDPLEVTVAVTGGFPGQAHVRREVRNERGKRREVVERMRQVPSPDGESGFRSFRHLFPVVDESFRYRVACGHGLTRFYDVTAVDRPEVESLAIRYAYPAYTRQAEHTQDSGATEIAAVPGTRVELVAKLNREGLRSTLALRPSELDATNAVPSEAKWSFEIERGMDTQWAILLADAYGFTNFPAYHAVRAVPDRAPTLVLDRPATTRLTLPPHAKVGLGFTVTDDFGVGTPELHVGLGDEPLKPMRPTQALTETAPGSWLGADALDLSSLALAGVRRVRLQLSVADNLPPELGGPQVAQSPVVTVEIDYEALSLETQTLQEQAKNVEETLKQAVERLKDAEKAAEEIEKKAEKEGKLDPADQQKLDEIRRDAALAEELVKKLAEEASETAFEPLREKLEKLAEEKVTPAREEAEEAQLANPADQPKEVAELEDALEEAVKAAEETLKDAQEFAEKLEEIAALDELAMKQDALAETAEDALTPEQMEEWEKMQEQLAEELKSELADDPAALRDALQERQEELKDLAQEAKDLSQEQEKLEQLTKDLAKPETREQAAQELQQATPDAPPEATPEQRAAMQEEQIAEKAGELEDRAQELAQDLQEFGEPTQPVAEPTQQAAQELGKAEEKASEAAEAMEKPQEPVPGQPPPPAPAELQQAAEQALEKAAEKLEASQKAMEELMGQLEEQAAAAEPLMPPEALGEALGEMEKAAEAAEAAQEQPGEPQPGEPQPGQPPPPGPMQPAAEAAKQAAQQLQQMVQQAAQQLGVPMPTLPSQQAQPTMPGQALDELRRQSRSRQEAVGEVPDALKGVLSQSDWFRLRGEVRAGAMDDALRGVPAEYRELVRLYFRELAKQGQ